MAGDRVVPVHTTVPGRARLKVAGLHRCEAMRRRLERGLTGIDGITGVTASPRTGNVLIHFPCERPLAELVARIEALLEGVGTDGGAAAQPSLPAAAREPSAPARRDDEPWHLQDVEAVCAALATSPGSGLDQREAEGRLTRFGPNALPEPEPRSRLAILLAQLVSLPVALLAASALLSLATGGVVDAIAIAGVVALNAAIGYATESHAEAAIASLQHLSHPAARVVRGDREIEVDARALVPGDVLALGPGSFVGADARVVRAVELAVDESVLTGESAVSTKATARLDRPDLPLGDRHNMVYRGTAVTSGEGQAVVVGTGMSTEIGRIQAMVGGAERPETPMERQLQTIGTQLVLLCGGVCGLVFAVGLLRGYGLLPMLRTSVSLAVAAVPEGLPALATSTLAIGIGAMRRHRVQVRHLGAIETLGSVQVLCFDKTGTLTRNEMSVVEVACNGARFRIDEGRIERGAREPVTPADEPGLARLLEIAALCNETEVSGERGALVLNGSPTESALVRLALHCGIDVRELRARHPLATTYHRTEERPYVVTVHRGLGERRLVAVKGNPMAVLGLCGAYLEGGGRFVLGRDEREAITRDNDRMADRALRVLGFAFAEIDDLEEALSGGLTWVGLAGLADPVRGGMNELMATLHRAGTRTVMITGDQSATAHAIAKALDLGHGREVEILDSAHLDRLSAEMLTALAGRAHVFARVSPAHKLQIVQALQRAGKVVAMTGDGINDGPALKAADIGIAMGRGGTDLAREVADVILEDDDLRTMALAVGQGRTIYDNIRKAIHYLLATNLSEVVVTLGATTAGVAQPLSPIQLLWINLVTDVLPAVGLALEPPEPDVLERPPRDPAASILEAEDFRRIAQEALVISGGALGAYAFGLARHGAGPTASTIGLASLITAQLLHGLTSRSDRHGAFTGEKLPPNPWLTAGLGTSLALQLAAFVFPPLRTLLGITPLVALDAAVALLGGTAPYLLNEAIKAGRQEHPPRGATT